MLAGDGESQNGAIRARPDRALAAARDLLRETAGQRPYGREASSLGRLPGEKMRSNRAILASGDVAACQNSSIRASGEDSPFDDALLLQGKNRPAMRIAKRAGGRKL